jgi:hypothetical protein
MKNYSHESKFTSRFAWDSRISRRERMKKDKTNTK